MNDDECFFPPIFPGERIVFPMKKSSRFHAGGSVLENARHFGLWPVHLQGAKRDVAVILFMAPNFPASKQKRSKSWKIHGFCKFLAHSDGSGRFHAPLLVRASLGLGWEYLKATVVNRSRPGSNMVEVKWKCGTFCLQHVPTNMQEWHCNGSKYARYFVAISHNLL